MSQIVTIVPLFKSLWQMTLESRLPQLSTAVQLSAVAGSAWVMDPVERACRGECNNWTLDTNPLDSEKLDSDTLDSCSLDTLITDTLDFNTLYSNTGL